MFHFMSANSRPSGKGFSTFAACIRFFTSVGSTRNQFSKINGVSMKFVIIMTWLKLMINNDKNLIKRVATCCAGLNDLPWQMLCCKVHRQMAFHQCVFFHEQSTQLSVQRTFRNMNRKMAVLPYEFAGAPAFYVHIESICHIYHRYCPWLLFSPLQWGCCKLK